MTPTLHFLQNVGLAAFVVTIVLEFPYMAKSVGIPSALFWIWLSWPMRTLMPSGTEYDRIYDNTPEWLKRTQTALIVFLVGIWLLGKFSRSVSN